MWQVFEHRRVSRKLDSLSLEILKRYEKWKDIVGISGPQGLRRIRGFRDEALRGEWRGYRSSRLGAQYRLIYEVRGDKLQVAVLEVNTHDYRRK